MMGFGPFDGKENGEHNRIGSVEISKIFVMNDDFVFTTGSLDGVWIHEPHVEAD